MATALSTLQPINPELYEQHVRATLASIQEAISVQDLTYYSNRPPAEIEALQKEVAKVVPAGNIVALVTSGLISLRGRKLPTGQAESDVSALLRGFEVLPKTLFGTFFVPTAAILSAYQNLLEMTGKDQDSAFPNGLWQFYLEFAMREDAAHHANETIGFQTALTEHHLSLSEIDQLAAWVCAVSQLYFQYDALLECTWRESVYLDLFEKLIAEADLTHKLRFQQLSKTWGLQRPYGRGTDAAPDETYTAYRRRRFDDFINGRQQYLPDALQTTLKTQYAERVEEGLADYLDQMTILTSLTPERYRENRQPLPLWQATIGVIVRGRYYLIPACTLDDMGDPILFASHDSEADYYSLQVDEAGELYDTNGDPLHLTRSGYLYDEAGDLRGTLQPIHFQTVRAHLAAIFEADEAAADEPSLAEQMLHIRRTEQTNARRAVTTEENCPDLDALRTAPILINWDEQDGWQPLSYIRRGLRGIGDHAATIFRTTNSVVFDQSHIFFDGVLGLAVAEILTREAISWAALFAQYDPPTVPKTAPSPLHLPYDTVLIDFEQYQTYEVSVENRRVDLTGLAALRKQLPKHHFTVKPTVNDFLILHRCHFGFEYQPAPEVQAAIDECAAHDSPQMAEAHDLIQQAITKLQETNPAILIPLDASIVNPRDRLYPTTFRNPFNDIWSNYQATHFLLREYRAQPTKENWSKFADARGSLLTKLNYFGEVLRAYKRVAMQGGSTSTATMKLLGHLPDQLREILNFIPEQIDVLNEILKGEEVMSNVGRVARGSSVTRFISAKDDNENKTLVWGILTDNREVMCLSLRDFRPHVTALAKLKRLDLAEMIATDQMNAFVTSFNRFVTNLTEIISMTRDTHT